MSLEHTEGQESVAEVVADGVAHGIAHDGRYHDQHAQDADVDVALAGDDAGDQHRRLSRQDESDEERRLAEDEQHHQDVDQRARQSEWISCRTKEMMDALITWTSLPTTPRWRAIN